MDIRCLRSLSELIPIESKKGFAVVKAPETDLRVYDNLSDTFPGTTVGIMDIREDGITGGVVEVR